jgi:hypothetical protein
MDKAESINVFIEYSNLLSGDEKGEAQVFCDRLFRAFGHDGYKEAGATLEYGVKRKGKSTRLADLLWSPRLLLEMKKRGTKLERHYQQAFEYWLRLVPDRPRYVILCNFDEFWIYDFNSQLDDPVDILHISELGKRYTALNFLFPEEKKPLFGNDRVAVTRAASDKVSSVLNSLIQRGESREVAQRYILQCVVALFAEDIGLLPAGLFSEIIQDCLDGSSSYDLIGNLFNQMNSPKKARGGRYKEVQYFNGDLFDIVEPIELTNEELNLLFSASKEDWAKVHPPIFGTLFEQSMDQEERHAFGAHFTSEAEIQKIVLPTIVRPWREKIERAKTAKDLLSLREELCNIRVLDPACGSGNFLYVAYREVKRLETDILDKLHTNFGARTLVEAGGSSQVSVGQFYGIDVKSFAVELAKVTLMIGKKLAYDEANETIQKGQMSLGFDILENPLPLDNLDHNVVCNDALFCEWPEVNYIIGNPPFQSKNKIKEELGEAYVKRVRKKYPGVPGRADYCVYWFRRTHDELPPGGSAGLVGTNTIRQNYSREGGLDYILANNGTISEAVSSQVWPGEAVVYVSIVNWVKGVIVEKSKRRLYNQIGDHVDSSWEVAELDVIYSSLSTSHIDVTKAIALQVNAQSKCCYQGQTHGHKGFLLSPEVAEVYLTNSVLSNYIYPYMIGEDLIGSASSQPSRYIIDLNEFSDVFSAQQASDLFQYLEREVYPDIKEKADREREKTKKDKGPRQSHLNKWWKYWRDRGELIGELEGLQRYVVCVRVTRRPIFEFISTDIRPNDSLQVFPVEDDYSFGILQSSIHWQWFVERCSTLKGDFRYTSNTVFDSFPWPQDPSQKEVESIANISRSLRDLRNEIKSKHNMTLREIYKMLEKSGKNPLRELQDDLDNAVRKAYGMRKRDNILEFLLELNGSIHELEQKEQAVTGPGVPSHIQNIEQLISGDCVELL